MNIARSTSLRLRRPVSIITGRSHGDRLSRNAQDEDAGQAGQRAVGHQQVGTAGLQDPKRLHAIGRQAGPVPIGEQGIAGILPTTSSSSAMTMRAKPPFLV